MDRPLEEIVGELIQRRRDVAKEAMEAGVSRRGDLTQLDWQISILSGVLYDQQHSRSLEDGRSR